jgi:heme exporter protein D
MTMLESFFAMGGYGAFVWPAFAATAAVLLALWLESLLRLRQRQRTLDRLEADLPARRARRPVAGQGPAT